MYSSRLLRHNQLHSKRFSYHLICNSRSYTSTDYKDNKNIRKPTPEVFGSFTIFDYVAISILDYFDSNVNILA